jgi:ABC-2 type transport system ATP-binding protein
MLKVFKLNKQFNGIAAVDNITFNIENGTIFGLLGPNGAGKTTTIRAILNIIHPTSGIITLNEAVIKDKMLNKTGYLPEDRGIYKKSKVTDALLYFAALKGLNAKKAIYEADLWLEKLNIAMYRKRKIEELSKGNQQKVQFISSVIHDPELLILDEPFSGFDPINQLLIKDILLSFRDKGKIIILSTHQMETAENLCSEILLINKGKNILSGQINDIKTKCGKNKIKIEFEGDSRFIKGLPFVKNVETSGTSAEVELFQGTEGYILLNAISDKIKIREFTPVQPALNEIFIDVVRNNTLCS